MFELAALQRGVVTLTSIREMMESAGPPLKVFATYREAELLGLLGDAIASIDGMCMMREIGDPALDPFRGFLLKMLRIKGGTVRRADVMEAAEAALGHAPSNAVYMKCMGDLCTSRGSTWVLRDGKSMMSKTNK